MEFWKKEKRGNPRRIWKDGIYIFTAIGDWGIRMGERNNRSNAHTLQCRTAVFNSMYVTTVYKKHNSNPRKT